jgi:hypothetical protein
MKIFLLVCSLALFTSCINNTNQANSKIIDSIVNKIRIQESNSSLNFINQSLKNEYTIENNAIEISKILNKNSIGSKLVLMLITSNFDCSTCINKQFTEMMKLFNVEQLQKHIVIITTPEHLSLLEQNWSKFMNNVNVITHEEIETLQKIYGYKNYSPVYIFFDKTNQKSLGSYLLDQKFSQIDVLYLDRISQIIKNSNN